MDEAPRDARANEAPDGPGSEPSARELLRWSAILFGVSLAIAAIAIPLLHWLGFDGGG